jgi:hypothetical protein
LPGHLGAKGIQLRPGQFGGPGLPVLPAVDGSVADAQLPGEVFLAQSKLAANFFYQHMIIRIYSFHLVFLKGHNHQLQLILLQMLYYPLENIKLFWNEIARKNDFIDRWEILVLGDALRVNALAISSNRLLC